MWGGRRILPSSQELSPPDELDAYCTGVKSEAKLVSFVYEMILLSEDSNVIPSVFKTLLTMINK